MTLSTLRLTVLGQALVQHDLRAVTWPDLANLAAMFERRRRTTASFCMPRSRRAGLGAPR